MRPTSGIHILTITLRLIISRASLLRTRLWFKFPVMQGKYREFFDSSQGSCSPRAAKANDLAGSLEKFPTRRNREFFMPNRDRNLLISEFGPAIRERHRSRAGNRCHLPQNLVSERSIAGFALRRHPGKDGLPGADISVAFTPPTWTRARTPRSGVGPGRLRHRRDRAACRRGSAADHLL